VIVEHDEETMRRADHIIDLGPGAGGHGIVARNVAYIESNEHSETGRFAKSSVIPRENASIVRRSRAVDRNSGARAHNLKSVDARFRGLTRSSLDFGSGKSTLMRSVLLRQCGNAEKQFGKQRELFAAIAGPNRLKPRCTNRR
jgi:excinuclease ABC subunit A